MSATSKSLIRALYRGLIRKAILFDKYPVLKATLTLPRPQPNLERTAFLSPWLGIRLYTPSISFKECVRIAFRKSTSNPAEDINYAFKVLRTMNKAQDLISKKLPDFLSNPYIPQKEVNTSSKCVLPTDTVKKGTLLIAHPYILSNDFRRSVVLICSTFTRGSSTCVLGLILNAVSSSNVRDNYLIKHPPGSHGNILHLGGPVSMGIDFHFLTRKPLSKSEEVIPGVYYTDNYTAISEALAIGDLRPEEYKAFYRCSLWLTEQLEEEIAAGSWFVAEATPDYIFQVESDAADSGKLLPPTVSSSQNTPAVTTAATSAADNTTTAPSIASSSPTSTPVVSATSQNETPTNVTKSGKKDDVEKKGNKMSYRMKFWKQTLEIMGGEYAHIAQFPELDSIPPDLNLAHMSEA
jgi:putative AlgH/UPF0301 family transcriptional regulator